MGLIFGNQNNQDNYNQEQYYKNDSLEYSKKCKDCKNNDISSRFKKTSILLCEKCYFKRKKQIFDQEIQFKGIVQIDEITPKVFLGNNEGAKSKEILKSYGITHILVVGYFLNEYYPSDFTYMTIEIEDSDKERIIQHLIPAIEFIEQGEKTYVHCRAGISRSSSIVIAYIMLTNQMTYEDARAFVETKRKSIEPNENFVNQLQKFSDILKICGYKYRLVKEFLISFGKEG